MLQKICCDDKSLEVKMSYLDALEFQRRIEEAETIDEIVADRCFKLGCENKRVDFLDCVMRQGKYTLQGYM